MQVQHLTMALQKCYNVPFLVESILNIDIHVARGNRPILDIVDSSSGSSTFNSTKLILRHRQRRRMHTSESKLKEMREHYTHILNIATHLMYLQCEKQEQRQNVPKTQSTVLRWWTKTLASSSSLDERTEGQDIVNILLLHPDRYVDSIPVESYVLTFLWTRVGRRSYFFEILEKLLIRSLRCDTTTQCIDFGSVESEVKQYLVENCSSRTFP